MDFLKAALDGIGTASGVSWPLFGILSAILALGAGGAGSIILSGLCVGAFLFFALPLLVIFYKQAISDQRELQQDLNDAKNSLLQNLALSSPDFQPPGDDKVLNAFLVYVQARDKNQSDKRLIADFISEELPKFRPNIPLGELIKPFYLVFPGIFGTFMGGAAGIMGVLSGLGIISGFAAIPIIGWAIFGIALVAGTVMTANAIHRAYKSTKQRQTIQVLENLNQALSGAMPSLTPVWQDKRKPLSPALKRSQSEPELEPSIACSSFIPINK